MRMAPAAFLLLGACQGEAPVADKVEPPKAPAPETETAVAERLVRARLGAAGEIRFAAATRAESDGVPIVCGAYEQGGMRQRYIVVARDRAFIEPQMRAGEMDRAVAEFCRGSGERG